MFNVFLSESVWLNVLQQLYKRNSRVYIKLFVLNIIKKNKIYKKGNLLVIKFLALLKPRTNDCNRLQPKVIIY